MRDALNPKQFGLLPPLEWEDQEHIGNHLGQQTWDPKKINIQKPLRANHDIYPDAVDYYKNHPRGSFTGDPDRNPTVIRYKDEHVILSGHHRIVAARQRGQKTMKVDYGEVS